MPRVPDVKGKLTVNPTPDTPRNHRTRPPIITLHEVKSLTNIYVKQFPNRTRTKSVLPPLLM